MMNSDLTRFDKIVLEWLMKLYAPTRQRVKTIEIALYVTKSPRTIRGALAKLEAAGKVQRVDQRRGWLPVESKDASVFMKASMVRPAYPPLTSQVYNRLN